MCHNISAYTYLSIAVPHKSWDRDEVRRCLCCGRDYVYYSDLCARCTRWAANLVKAAVVQLVIEDFDPVRCSYDYDEDVPGWKHGCKLHRDGSCLIDNRCLICHNIRCECTC